MEVTPVGLEDTSKYPDVIYKCMERGATDEQIRGLMGGNLLRVWKNVEKCSENIKKEQFPDGRVVESEWEGREWEFFDYLKDINDIFKDSKKIYWDKTKLLPSKH
ncbi:unnamed protein product [[Candida] boidinii]|nr:unnamed protein product [[Candida] boidinii]